MPLNGYMVADVERQAPDGWTVEHLDDDSCPSQGWGAAPGDLRWYFRNRHGRWTFAVGEATTGLGDFSGKYVACENSRWFTWGVGDMLPSDEIIAIVLDCMATCAGAAHDANVPGQPLQQRDP